MKHDKLYKLADTFEKLTPTMTKGTLSPASLGALQSLITTLRGCLGATGTRSLNYFINTPADKDKVLVGLKYVVADLQRLMAAKTAIPYGLAATLREWNKFYDTMNSYMRRWFLASADRQMKDFINATGMKPEVDKILSWLH